MRTLAPPPFVLLAPLALLGALPAQSNDSRGLLAGSATTVLVDGGLPSGANDATGVVHPNGVDMPAPRFFPAMTTLASTPDLAAILQLHGAPSTLDVDDISTGRDEILIDQDGFLDVPDQMWSVWSFSLTSAAVGEPLSRIAREANGGQVGAALFSYVLPGSSLPAELVGRVERSHSRADLGLDPTVNEVDAIDVPLVLGLDQTLAHAGGQLLTEPNWGPLIGGTTRTIYFTVSHATRDLVPASWWGTTTRSGATVLCTTFTPFSGVWSQPSVFLPYDALGLGADEDVDALAIDVANEKVLFSTTGTARDQFLFVDLSTDGAGDIIKEVKKPDGEKVSESVGKAQGDDIDAVCTLDPQLNDVGEMDPGGDDFGSSVGVPRPGLLGVPELDGSAFRSYEAGTILFDSFMVGWPSATGPAPALAVLFVTLNDDFNLIPLGPVHLRDPGDPVAGNPQTERLIVPPAAALTGARLTFRWVHIDGAAFSIHEVRPVQVFL